MFNAVKKKQVTMIPNMCFCIKVGISVFYNLLFLFNFVTTFLAERFDTCPILYIRYET